MVGDNDYAVKLGLDLRDFNKSFKDLEKRFASFDKDMKVKPKMKSQGINKDELALANEMNNERKRQRKAEKTHQQAIEENQKRINRDSLSSKKKEYNLAAEMAAMKKREIALEKTHSLALIENRKRDGRKAGAGNINVNERQNRNIELQRLQVRAEEKLQTLRKIGGKETQGTIARVENTLKSLKHAQDNLAKSTKKTDATFLNYNKTLQGSKDQLTKVGRESAQLTKRFNANKFAANGMTDSLKNMARSWVSVFAIMAGVSHLKNTAAEMENIGVASLLASGNAVKSAEDLKYVDALTERLGLRYKDTAKAFATFNVAAISGGVDPEKAKQVFTNLTEGLASSATSAESAKLALLGFRQMISGSVVQAQEINQVVDQVPAFMGAATAALNEMGITAKDHLSENGKSFKDTIKTAGVDAKKFTEIVARNLSDMGKQSGSLLAAMGSISAEETRMINAKDKAVEGIANAGLGDLLKSIFSGAAILIEAITPALKGLTFGFSILAKVLTAPLRLLDNIAQILGMDEGQGLVWAFRILGILLIPKLVIALSGMTAQLAAGAINAMAMTKGFFAMSTGTSVATKGLLAMRFALRSLLRTALPLFLLMEGLNWVYDKLSTPSKLDSLGRNVISNGSSNKTSNTQVNIDKITLTQTSGESPEEFGRRLVGEMDLYSSSQAVLF